MHGSKTTHVGWLECLLFTPCTASHSSGLEVEQHSPEVIRSPISLPHTRTQIAFECSGSWIGLNKFLKTSCLNFPVNVRVVYCAELVWGMSGEQGDLVQWQKWSRKRCYKKKLLYWQLPFFSNPHGFQVGHMLPFLTSHKDQVNGSTVPVSIFHFLLNYVSNVGMVSCLGGGSKSWDWARKKMQRGESLRRAEPDFGDMLGLQSFHSGLWALIIFISFHWGSFRLKPETHKDTDPSI